MKKWCRVNDEQTKSGQISCAQSKNDRAEAESVSTKVHLNDRIIFLDVIQQLIKNVER